MEICPNSMAIGHLFHIHEPRHASPVMFEQQNIFYVFIIIHPSSPFKLGEGYRKIPVYPPRPMLRDCVVTPSGIGPTTQLGEGLLISLHIAGPCIIYSPN